ncbi:MAG: AmmeMemoRadiSam system protein B, partial [Deltaproteobacteria bacterium]|nr:AmmeMemoRadiSam system protein B [Deltaproteobacteria bacterium]
KRFFPNAKILLIGAPPCSETLELAEAIVKEANEVGRELLFFGSTDLSHYGPNYDWMPKGGGAEAEHWVREVNDARFIQATLKEDSEQIIVRGLAEQSACCPGAAAAAIHAARCYGDAPGQQLRYATSADTRPDESFVGYAGLVF